TSFSRDWSSDVCSSDLATLAERERAGRNTRLLVRICPESFAGQDMPALIAAELARHGVAGERLWLQAPEAKVFTHLREAQQFLRSEERRVGKEWRSQWR